MSEIGVFFSDFIRGIPNNQHILLMHKTKKMNTIEKICRFWS